MSPDWRPAWRAVLPRLLLIAAVALIALATLGATWAWASAGVGLLLTVVAQTRQIIVLDRWLKAPDRAEFPDADGIWGEAFIGIARHLRAQTQAKHDVEESLRSFEEAIEALPEGIILLDPKDQILWCNRAADRHLGISLPRDTRAIITQLVRTPGFAEFLRRTDSDARFVLTKSAMLTRNYELKLVPFGERNKILVSVDVTDAKRTETIRSDFVANVSHELRTPLTVVSGFIEHFLDGQAMTAEQRRHFALLMRVQTDRMLSLVDDLLTLSRLEAEDTPTSEENVDMDTLVAELLTEAEGLSGGRHRITARADGSVLRGNWKELRSAFTNLVSNAVRYTPDGGRISIEWSRHDGSGRFSVSDTGFGIAAEHLPRLTERFYRVDRGRSRDSGGTGLGLAIVKHVLLRHQASLEIKSEPGQGSTFTAVFPPWRGAAPKLTNAPAGAV